ncbi:hypothetical protein F2P81_025110 [Scophthalmus maximus]|uniref:Uncharacterized protein n=1 Tax=Scophthalmus maximus TaxID=52904 RepID=A0A6A4RRQ5_SCOMX|nr:hypothetical protein F2P81_025110 [Scophthalmus maximus]
MRNKHTPVNRSRSEVKVPPAAECTQGTRCQKLSHTSIPHGNKRKVKAIGMTNSVMSPSSFGGFHEENCGKFSKNSGASAKRRGETISPVSV